MDYKVTGIVIRSVDYGEKDKIITIFSLELGKITARLKGVKSPNSKLKYAGQPFCFGQFEIANGKSNVITGCSLEDSFYDITCDIDKFECGSIILQALDKFTVQDNLYEQLFIHAICALNEICYGQNDPRVIVIKFLIDALRDLGYGIDFAKCSSCGGALVGNIAIDLSIGNIVCSKCADAYHEPISAKSVGFLKLIDNTGYDNMQSIKCKNSDISSVMHTLDKIISIHLGVSIIK